MDEHIDPQDHETVERLRAFGRRPVDPPTASAHLTAMADAAPRRSPWRTKVAVAGAFLAGLLLGGTGLATAGALPDPAQEVAFNVLHRTGMHVPHPHEGNLCKGPPLWVLERRTPEANEEAAHDQFRAENCPQRAEGQGPPDHVRSGEHRGGPPAHARGPAGRPGAAEGGPGRAGARGEGCSGPPPWAGPPEWAGEEGEPEPSRVEARRQMREDLRAQWRQDCGLPAGDEDE
jgi:hypothetical protein